MFQTLDYTYYVRGKPDRSVAAIHYTQTQLSSSLMISTTSHFADHHVAAVLCVVSTWLE